MTGFARAEGDDLGISWVWEMKSVNSKSLDLRLRLAPGFDSVEPQLRAMLAQRFRRGNFSASLAVTRLRLRWCGSTEDIGPTGRPDE
jgi:uncharacterized protein YicC (UPF0701 family)